VLVKNPRAYRVYLFMSAASSFCLTTIFLLAAVYRLQTVHLDALQLVLVGTVLELSSFVFEVPTGVVADTYSRRLSVILGFLFIGAAELVEGSIPAFAAVLLTQVISGLGYTFLSGATEAWIAGEVGEEHLTHVFQRAGQFGQVGNLLGIGAAVGLGSVGLNWPLLAGGIGMIILGLVLALVMPETGFDPTPRGERTSWQHMTATFRDGLAVIRARPVLLSFLVIAVFFGMTSEGIDRLWEAHLLTNFAFPALGGLTSLVWFGLISVAGSLLYLGGTEVVRRRVNTDQSGAVVRALIVLNVLAIGALILFGIADSFALAVAAFLIYGTCRGLGGPLHGAWLARSIDPRVRATVLSMISQVDAVGQVAGGPVIGAVGKVFSIRAALVLTGVLLAPTLPLFVRAGRRARTAQEAVEMPVALPDV
jgi:DHA3 family tetracycline resistance protein-like MFS transporter